MFTLLFLFFILSFIILSPSLSPHYLSISSFFLHNPQTLLSSSETHRRFARAQPPQTRRRRPTFGHRPNPFRPLFSIFDVSVLCFKLCLCFGFVFRTCLCFEFVFRAAWICVWGWVFVSGMGFCVWFRRLGN